MSETFNNPLTERQAHVERAWGTLNHDAKRYGEMFAQTFRPVIQEQLEGLQDHRHTSYIEYIEQYTDGSTGKVGGNDTFFREEVASPSYLHGVAGFSERPSINPADKVILDLSVEALENEAMGAPSPEQSVPGYYWLHQRARQDLARLATYWYRLGASDRLDGSVERRRAYEAAEAIEESLPLEPETAEEFFTFGTQGTLWELGADDIEALLEKREYGRHALGVTASDNWYDNEIDEVDALYELSDEFYSAIVAGTYTAYNLANDARYRARKVGNNPDVQSLAEQVVYDIRRESGTSSDATSEASV